MAAEPLSRLPRDLLVEVLARVDGPTLASAACACAGLRGAAKEEALWEELCRCAWPSTGEATARELVSSMPGGFAKFYADSLPLLLYPPHRPGRSINQRSAGIQYPGSLEHLVSFVDVYYRKKCVLSRVVQGIPTDDLTAVSLGCSFNLDALGATAVDGGDQGEAQRLPSFPLEPKEEGGVGVLNWTLEEDLTVSWVLLDAREGRAVNISGPKPTLVQRDWPSKGDLVVRFGCPVPVERQLLACGVAECVVSLRCRLSEAEDRLGCTAIELEVEDAEGAGVDRCRSLAVLETALCCRRRTKNHGAAAEGYRQYKKERKGREREREGVAGNMLRALSAVVLFVALCLSLL